MIDIHTCRWTGTMDRYGAYMDAIAAFSFAHTNSNFYDTDDKWDKAYDQFEKRCEEIGRGEGYTKTVHPHQVAKSQLKIPFPDFDYNKLDFTWAKKKLLQWT